MTSRLRIIVTGLVGLYPVGGVAWDYLQYVVGLARLGHDVYYHEDTRMWPYHPIEMMQTSRGDYSVEYIERFFARYAPELRTRWHYRHLEDTSFGMTGPAFADVARTADLFLNVSGACPIPDDLSPRCLKIFLDTDPGYNQIVLSERFAWSEKVEGWCRSVAAHDRHLTYAENIHSADCTVPKLGLTWGTTRMPIVQELWESVARIPAPATAPWTTVMTWKPFKGKLMYQGTEYGSKGPAFEPLINLPQHVRPRLKIAVGGHEAPFDRLAQGGWDVVDGPKVSRMPQDYQDFIGESRGEVSAAKHVYVALRTGWFSCRSACYLAAARPVVVQDTGFGSALPIGEGILAFSLRDEAAAAIDAVEHDYDRHARSARAIANEYFDSAKVLTALIETVFRAV